MSNELLGSGVEVDKIIATKRIQMPDLNYPAPAWRYHKTLCPEGKIIRTDEELAVLDSQGWVKMPRFDEPIVEVSALTSMASEQQMPAPDVLIPEVAIDEPVKEIIDDEPLVETKKELSLKDEIVKDVSICPICNKKMANRQALTAHSRMAHKKG